MTQRRPNAGPNSDPTDEWLPVAGAAARLGVTTDAVRMRAKRGTIPSRKVGRRLEVLVARPNSDPTPDRSVTERTTQRATQRDDEPIEVPYRVAGEPDRALVPVETMLDGMRSLGDRLAELAQRNEALAVEVGALRERAGHQEQTIGRLETERDELRAERDNDRSLAGQLVDLLQTERDELRAEVERLRAGEDTPRTHPGPPGTTQRAEPGREASPAWWRRWLRRATRSS